MINKKNRVKRESRIDRILEVPKEISTNEPKVTILGFKKMMVENYKAILEYQEVYIRVKLHTGFVNVSGLNLKLGEMNSDDIIITGDIENIEFEKIE